MKNKKDPQQPKIRSFVALDSFLNRKAGTHDGSKKQRARAARRDKSYREER